MTEVKMNIWGRSFDLDVEYDCYPDEQILPEQYEAVDQIQNCDVINKSLKSLEEYILKEDGEEHGIDKVTNIFRYVIPVTLYAARTKGKRTIGLLCEYRFDEDNGIALVFENEILRDIDSQDIII